MLIRIIKVPQGEAPEDVREAWVGLILPCRGKFFAYSSGVLTGEPVDQEQEDYHVWQDIAITILSKAQPVAAAWWKAHGYPKVSKMFGFHEDEVIVL